MKKPKTIKSLLSTAISLATVPIYPLKGINKLSEKDKRRVSELTVSIQNDLGEMNDILEKYNLKY